MKKILLIIKRIVFSFGVMYGINIVLINSGIFIPINTISISAVSLLGMPAVISLLLINYIIR